MHVEVHFANRADTSKGHLIHDQFAGDEERPYVAEAVENVGDKLALRVGNQKVGIKPGAKPGLPVMCVRESCALQDERHDSVCLECREHAVQLSNFDLVQNRRGTMFILDLTNAPGHEAINPMGASGREEPIAPLPDGQVRRLPSQDGAHRGSGVI